MIYTPTKKIKKILNTNYKNGYSLYQVWLENGNFVLYLGDKKFIIKKGVQQDGQKESININPGGSNRVSK